MSDQAHFWSKAAKFYEQDFIDPYLPEVRSPLQETLSRLADPVHRVAADLGCGIGPLLPFLAERFHQVYAVDFAEGMFERTQERSAGFRNIEFLHRPLTDLQPLSGQVDVAVAVNSLVLPDIKDLELVLRQIRGILRPGGVFLGILPAMDAVHYYTMLLVDRALDAGMPMDAAHKNAADYGDHDLHDFAFGQFRFRGLKQHFWQPFEVRHRLRRAGFRLERLVKVSLSWSQFSCGGDLQLHPPPWDWFFRAVPSSLPSEAEG